MVGNVLLVVDERAPRKEPVGADLPPFDLELRQLVFVVTKDEKRQLDSRMGGALPRPLGGNASDVVEDEPCFRPPPVDGQRLLREAVDAALQQIQLRRHHLFGKVASSFNFTQCGECPRQVLHREQCLWMIFAHHSPSERDSNGRCIGPMIFHHSLVLGSAAILAMSDSKSVPWYSK